MGFEPLEETISGGSLEKSHFETIETPHFEPLETPNFEPIKEAPVQSFTPLSEVPESIYATVEHDFKQAETNKFVKRFRAC